MSDVQRDVEQNGGSCGQWRGVTLTLEGEGILLMREPETSPLNSLDPAKLSGSVNDFEVEHARGYVFSYSDGLCSVWPSADDTLTLQFASMDLAGNFSGWGETQRFKQPSFSDPACSVGTRRTGSSTPLCAVSFALFALIARRRRRQRD